MCVAVGNTTSPWPTASEVRVRLRVPAPRENGSEREEFPARGEVEERRGGGMERVRECGSEEGGECDEWKEWKESKECEG